MNIFKPIKKLEKQRTKYNIDQEEGQLLNSLVKIIKPKNILEIGTANAYSTLWLAEAARKNNGKIITIEIDKNIIKLAKENIKLLNSKNSKGLEMSEKQSFSEHTPKSKILDESKTFQNKAKLEKTIKLLEGDALNIIPKLKKKFDFVFIDAIKKDYLKYFKLLEPKLSSKAIILAHNVISHKEKMLDYLDYVRKNFKSILIPVGDGMELSIKHKNEQK